MTSVGYLRWFFNYQREEIQLLLESGDEITFTAKEGMTEITIDSWIIPSESRHYIKPFLQHIKDTYGTPLVVIRDMSKEISGAASEIYPEVTHQICHSHYV
jgi:transposase-like protein